MRARCPRARPWWARSSSSQAQTASQFRDRPHEIVDFAGTPVVKLGICISGQGTNLRNLVERGFEVVAVATNRPSCGGAAFARERGLPLAELSQKAFATVEDRDAAMRDF